MTSITGRFARLRLLQWDREKAWNILTEYCNNTTLHCFKYFVDLQRTLIERIFWVLAVSTSLLVISLAIFNIWHNWSNSPVIVTFAENSSPTTDLPFPTVTICPTSKYVSSLFDFRGVQRKPRQDLKDDERTKLDLVSILCGDGMSVNERYFENNTNNTVKEHLNEIAPSEIIILKYENINRMKCKQYVDAVVAEDGLCHTFNALPATAVYTETTVQYGEGRDSTPFKPVWFMESGYVKNANWGAIPLRPLGNGDKHGVLMLVLTKTDVRHDYGCDPLRALTIALSSPGDAVSMLDVAYTLPVRGLTQVSLVPKVMSTSEQLRRYSPKERHCSYPSEIHLDYFKTYTQTNCKLECLTKFLLHRCGCVDYFMPRRNETPICGPGSESCKQKAGDEFRSKLVSGGIQVELEIDYCQCLPSCMDIQYAVEMSQVNIDQEDIEREYNLTNIIKGHSISMLLVHFKESEYVASVRREFRSFGTFLAECGGLLGLCCGFSFLSLVELIFNLFFRLRTTVTMKADEVGVDKRKEMKSNEDGL